MIVVREICGIADTATRRELAQSIVDENCGGRIVRDMLGAPSIENRAKFISISHTDQYVAVAFDDKQVGVDIEVVDRRAEHLKSRFASNAELEVAGAVFPQNPALLVWCAKEAIYKTLHREGVDFLRDMIVTRATADLLTAVADQSEVELKWEVKDKLLIVCTI